MTRYMLDADTAIYATNFHEKVTAALVTMRPGEVAMSSLVHSQLLQGLALQARRENARLRVKRLVSATPILSYDFAASEAYGEIVEALGFSRALALARMIAAHAISIGATLVTNNLADFAGIEGLRLENWAEA